MGQAMVTDPHPDAYYWAKSRSHGLWYLLRKQTDRQTYGQPWKLMDNGHRVTWSEVDARFDRVVRVEEPK